MICSSTDQPYLGLDCGRMARSHRTPSKVASARLGKKGAHRGISRRGSHHGTTTPRRVAFSTELDGLVRLPKDLDPDSSRELWSEVILS